MTKQFELSLSGNASKPVANSVSSFSKEERQDSYIWHVQMADGSSKKFKLSLLTKGDKKVPLALSKWQEFTLHAQKAVTDLSQNTRRIEFNFPKKVKIIDGKSSDLDKKCSQTMQKIANGKTIQNTPEKKPSFSKNSSDEKSSDLQKPTRKNSPSKKAAETKESKDFSQGAKIPKSESKDKTIQKAPEKKIFSQEEIDPRDAIRDWYKPLSELPPTEYLEEHHVRELLQKLDQNLITFTHPVVGQLLTPKTLDGLSKAKKLDNWIEDITKQIQTSDKKYFSMPFQVPLGNTTHFTQLFIEKKNDHISIEYHDSKGIDNNRKKIPDAIVSFIEKLTKAWGKDKVTQHLNPSGHQEDAWNCGLFVYYYAKLRTSGLPFADIHNPENDSKNPGLTSKDATKEVIGIRNQIIEEGQKKSSNNESKTQSSGPKDVIVSGTFHQPHVPKNLLPKMHDLDELHQKKDSIDKDSADLSKELQSLNSNELPKIMDFFAQQGKTKMFIENGWFESKSGRQTYEEAIKQIKKDLNRDEIVYFNGQLMAPIGNMRDTALQDKVIDQIKTKIKANLSENENKKEDKVLDIFSYLHQGGKIYASPHVVILPFLIHQNYKVIDPENGSVHLICKNGKIEMQHYKKYWVVPMKEDSNDYTEEEALYTIDAYAHFDFTQKPYKQSFSWEVENVKPLPSSKKKRRKLPNPSKAVKKAASKVKSLFKRSTSKKKDVQNTAKSSRATQPAKPVRKKTKPTQFWQKRFAEILRS